MDKENTDLTIEAIKLVELLSSLNIEDFQMNQWIFLIDGYGMQLESMDQNESLRGSIGDSEKPKEPQNPRASIKGQRGDEAQEDVFKTFIVRFIGNQDYSFYNVERPLDGVNHDRIDDHVGLDIDSSASPQSYPPNP